jgi:hypothetical protein
MFSNGVNESGLQDRLRTGSQHYETKQVEAYAIQENDDWLVISVITRYF